MPTKSGSNGEGAPADKPLTAAKRPKAPAPPAADDPTTTRPTRKGEPGAAPPASQTNPAPDQATASPSGPRVPAGGPAQATPAPVEPQNVGKPLPKPKSQTDTPGSTPAAGPTAATAAPAPAATPAAKPAAPAAPPAMPTGDHATLASAFQGTSFAILEDGVGVTTVATDDLFQAAAWAKSNGYPILSLLSAYDRTDHFGVLYAFVKLAATPAEFGELRLRVVMPKAAGEPVCPSLEDVYPSSGWHEREMFDMYGIRFEGNRDLRRMFLPDDWTGYPMRKDYKEPEQFVTLREGEDVALKTNEEGSW